MLDIENRFLPTYLQLCRAAVDLLASKARGGII